MTGTRTTRADGSSRSIDWSPRATLLNAARFGYTRRALNQTASMQAAPTYAPPDTSRSGRPPARTSASTTSVAEFVDTTTSRSAATPLKFGADIRREALEVLAPPNPAGAYSFNAAATGNSFAALLLGQVNGFSVDIQNEPLQPRAHIAEFFATDAWKLSPRLTAQLWNALHPELPVHREA